MIQNSSNSRCLKADFKPIEQKEEGVYILRWGYKDEVERVFTIDEETGKPVYTGETKETDWCSYESGEYRGVLKQSVLDKYFTKARRLPKMAELKSWGESMEMTEEQTLPWMKDYLLKAIAKHDKSSDVEDFTISGVHMWLDSTMRNKVKENLEYCQTMGIENTTLRYEGLAFPMTVTMGWQLYYSVLGYARATWDITQEHEAAVPKIETTDGMIEYEASFKSAYPEKLSF